VTAHKPPYDPSSDGWKTVGRMGFVEHIGPLWTRRNEDDWQYGILIAPQHLNPMGVVHGGLLMTLIDNAISTVAWEAVGRLPCLTAQMDHHFMGSVKLGQFVIGRARVAKKTSSLIFMQGFLSVEGDDILMCNSMMKITRPR
jgi:uncharacterized protein (TIGR00369 family)